MSNTRQFATFRLGDRNYGIDVMKVQEVTKTLPVTAIPLAPGFVKGLINLRGQISTAIGLRELFGLPASESRDHMSVVCKIDGNLMSLLVDSIGDVVEVPESSFEKTPATVQGNLRTLMSGVYKTENEILSVIDIENLSNELNKSIETISKN